METMRHISGTRFNGLTSLPLSGILGLVGLVAFAGCGQLQVDDSSGIAANVMTDNGLRTVNGLRARNGFDPAAGLSIGASLPSSAGLSTTTGLMTTTDGRTTVSYLARCALPPGHKLVKTDQYGKSYTFAGSLGVAPEWETGACGQSCQGWVTACMLAMVNTTGMHYPIWVDGQPTGVGWGTDPAYPLQEGSFFGNMFASDGPAYYCEGRDYGTKAIPGRIGGAQTDAPYADVWATNKCSTFCTPADIPHQNDGSKACFGFNQVLTVWHQ